MTRTEALRILVRYFPDRSIHVTHSLDSNFSDGDRRDSEMAIVTINPGINRSMPECFCADSMESAVKLAIEAFTPLREVGYEAPNAERREVLTKYGWKTIIVGQAGEDLRAGQVIEIDRRDGLMRAARFDDAERTESFATLKAQ